MILVIGLMVISVLLIITGIILDVIVCHDQQLFELYLLQEENKI